MKLVDIARAVLGFIKRVLTSKNNKQQPALVDFEYLIEPWVLD